MILHERFFYSLRTYVYVCLKSWKDYLIVCISLLGLCYKHWSRHSGCNLHVRLFVEKNEFQIVKRLFYNTCSLTFEHAPLKRLLKSATNRIDSFCSAYSLFLILFIHNRLWGLRGTLHMVSEPQLKHLGLIGLKTLLHVLLWNYMVTDLWSCAGEAGTLARKLQQGWPNTLSAQCDTRACKYTGIWLFPWPCTNMFTTS